MQKLYGNSCLTGVPSTTHTWCAAAGVLQLPGGLLLLRLRPPVLHALCSIAGQPLCCLPQARQHHPSVQVK